MEEKRNRPSTKNAAFVLLVSAALALGACGGRKANPISATRATDGEMSCDLMSAEIEANNSRVRSLVKEKEDAEGRNIAIGAVGVVLFWPALFFMDLSPTERQEMAAYRDRNDHLARLMRQKGCASIPPTSPAAAMKREIDSRINDAEASGKKPLCKDVGGYEYYLKKTNKTCML